MWFAGEQGHPGEMCVRLAVGRLLAGEGAVVVVEVNVFVWSSSRANKFAPTKSDSWGCCVMLIGTGLAVVGANLFAHSAHERRG
ncbi:MAG TPA: hypothetical protein DHV63_18560 [Pseudomonas sp.]|nr:hypothetical protein [Pseudomonas sp.]